MKRRSLWYKSFCQFFFSAYRKHYNANLVLINLIENWKKNHDSKKEVEAAFTDSSKAYDSIPRDLLTTKWKLMGSLRTFLLFVFIPEALKTLCKH